MRSEWPGYVFLDGSEDVDLYLGQKIQFELRDVKKFTDQFGDENFYLPKDTYEIEEVTPSIDFDPAEFGLVNVDFKRKTILYSYAKNACLPFTILIDEYDRNFKDTEIGIHIIPAVSHKIPSTDLTLTGFHPGDNPCKALTHLAKEKGFFVKELPQGLGAHLKTTEQFKGLVELLMTGK